MTVLVANISGSKLVTECATITCATDFAGCLFGASRFPTTVQFKIRFKATIITSANQRVTVFVANISVSELMTEYLTILNAANFANCRFGARSFPAAVQLIFGFEIAVVTSAN